MCGGFKWLKTKVRETIEDEGGREGERGKEGKEEGRKVEEGRNWKWNIKE